MNHKQMRQALKDAGKHAPRSNKDTEKAYAAFSGENNPTQENHGSPTKKADIKLVSTYTYIGSGDESPEKINFMGRQGFVRDEPTKVTDPLLLKKLKSHPCFQVSRVNES